jgi:hypothetical protein
MTTNVECHLDAAGLNPIAGYTDLLERHLGGDMCNWRERPTC